MDKNTAHILVVDDDTRLRHLLQRFLREQSFAVSTAKDAFEARSQMEQYKFDLLIVDVMMPGESGIDFLKNLRLESNVPVIMLTAMGETSDRITGLESSARRCKFSRTRRLSWPVYCRARASSISFRSTRNKSVTGSTASTRSQGRFKVVSTQVPNPSSRQAESSCATKASCSRGSPPEQVTPPRRLTGSSGPP